ncbi:hypothetical protein EK904_006957 [Melospiza melodia maxima]|nr:hypothetical protein EK904_006957 [Melospiza melodia maxima]
MLLKSSPTVTPDCTMNYQHMKPCNLSKQLASPSIHSFYLAVYLPTPFPEKGEGGDVLEPLQRPAPRSGRQSSLANFYSQYRDTDFSKEKERKSLSEIKNILTQFWTDDFLEFPRDLLLCLLLCVNQSLGGMKDPSHTSALRKRKDVKMDRPSNGAR